MDKERLTQLINAASGKTDADLVIKNGKIADVFSGGFIEADVAVCGGYIAGIGDYRGAEVIDAGGRYVLPGLIDGHIHIESTMVSPEELGRLLVPHGTTTIISDPHEIVNIRGEAGLDYMIRAAERTALDIKYMLPSCVPPAPFEHSGAVLDAAAMAGPLENSRILGLGEFMNFPSVVAADGEALDKLSLVQSRNKLADGHSPGLGGKALDAYAAAGIHTDHECSTVEDMAYKIARGMYVLLRQGSACPDLPALLKGLTPENSRRCVLCSDDRQLKTIFEKGHLEEHLRLCATAGVDAITAIRMATLNAAECFRLHDRGGVAPGLRADLILVEDLHDFHVSAVFIQGKLAAKDGRYLLPLSRCDDAAVRRRFQVKDFSRQTLSLKLPQDEGQVIDMSPESIITGKGRARVRRNEAGEFVYRPGEDIVKIAVVERHHNTGCVGTALLRGYGLSRGAIAISIAHDTHNIITVGADDGDMVIAVEKLIAEGGGIALVRDGALLDFLPLPLGGVMSDQSGEWVEQKLRAIHDAAYRELGINRAIEPVMTLCFMALPVLPKLKVTDRGLFDVENFAFIPVSV
ncbi:MAG: adenine deaminase [Treponema sp.]|jgi:adenine deaminase|nr:adenine deaminase [Treponema sp.]